MEDAPELLPIGPHDHPEPNSMMWCEVELLAIREYAARCVAADRERRADELARLRAEVEALRAGLDAAVAAEREACARLCEEVQARRGERFCGQLVSDGSAAQCAIAIRAR